MEEQKPRLVRNRSIRGLSAGRRPLFVSGCCPVYRRLFVAVNPFVQKMSGKITPHRITSHHITSHHITNHITPYHNTTPHHITSHHITPHRTKTRHMRPHHITSQHTVSHHTHHTCRLQNPDISRAGRGWSVHSRAAGQSGADGSMRPGITRSRCPPDHRRQPSWPTLRKHEQTNPYANGRRNETSG